MNSVEAVQFNPHGFRHILVSIGQQLRFQNIVSERDLERLGHWSKGSIMPDKYDSAAGVSELRARTALLDVVRNGWRPAKEGDLPALISQPLLPIENGCVNKGSMGSTGGAPIAAPSRFDPVVPGPVPVLRDRALDPSPSSLVPRDHARRSALSSSTPVSDGDSPVQTGGLQRGGALKRGFAQVSSERFADRVANTASRRVHIRGVNSVRSVCKAWTCGSRAQPSSNAMVLDIPADWPVCRICFG